MATQPVRDEQILITNQHNGRLINVSGAVSVIKDNFGAGSGPTSTSDAAAGYSKGSLWTTTAGAGYVCTDNTNGAANWLSLGGGATAWGTITGLLSAQSDLNTALNALDTRLDDIEAVLTTPGSDTKITSPSGASELWVMPQEIFLGPNTGNNGYIYVAEYVGGAEAEMKADSSSIWMDDSGIYASGDVFQFNGANLLTSQDLLPEHWIERNFVATGLTSGDTFTYTAMSPGTVTGSVSIELVGDIRSLEIATTSTSGNIAKLQFSSYNYVTPGSRAIRTSFIFQLQTIGTLQRFFCGLSSSSGPTNLNFTGVLNTIGIAKNASDANWYFVSNDGSVRTAVDSGLDVSTDPYRLDIDFTSAGAATIRLTNLASGQSSTNNPGNATTAAVFPFFWICNNEAIIRRFNVVGFWALVKAA